MLPDCVTDIVGKTYKFGVTTEKGTESFKVLKVWSVYNTLMVDSQSDTITGKETAVNSASEVFYMEYQWLIYRNLIVKFYRHTHEI